MATPTRPIVTRQLSRVPGGFDTDDELSPIKTDFAHEDKDDLEPLILSPHSPKSEGQPPARDVANRKIASLSDEGGSEMPMENETFLQEEEMRRRLDDMDSTFLPEVSPVARSVADDASTVHEERSEDGSATDVDKGAAREHQKQPAETDASDDDMPHSPITPPDSYRTPAPERQDERDRTPPSTAYYSSHPNTSSLETMSSSPTVAAAARTVSRAVSMASGDGGYETADDSKGGILLDQESTPRRRANESSSVRGDSPTPTNSPQNSGRLTDGQTDGTDFRSFASRIRPSVANSRMASQASSYSTYTTTSTEGGSDVTLGADFALQSGGAVPQGSISSVRPSNFSRSVSLGSMASGISDLSDGNDKIRFMEGKLDTLEEENSKMDEETPKNGRLSLAPETPSSVGRNINTPTDTVIGQRVQDVQVPATLAREYTNRQRPASPEKRNGANSNTGSRHGKNLTLKEQSGTIDRLVKENFDLKLKITFLDEALNRRSDEGVKAMISENVDLRTAKFKSAKETRELKRTLRDLERKVKEKTDELAQKANAPVPEEKEIGPDAETFQEMEEEISFLRERVTTYDIEIDRMRKQHFAQEREKKKLAEVVKRVGETGRGTDIGNREEVVRLTGGVTLTSRTLTRKQDLWKDLLDAETARREQSDEDNRRLREEVRRLKSDASSTTTNNHATNVYHVNRRQKVSSTLSYNDNSERAFDANGPPSAVSSTLVEQLRHETAELRREMHAQTAMLTSRNRERERLQQEIEDLKLGSRRGDGARSIAGDSIFERSASRALGRPQSRASDQTRLTQMSDPEREALEFKNGQLRDTNAKLKMEIQDLVKKTDELLDELEQLDIVKIEHEKLQRLYDNDISLATEDLQNLQRERDDVLQAHEDMEQELQDLKAEGSEKIGALEDELDQRNQELEQLHQELSNRSEDAEALRKEVRNLSESIMRTEEEMQGKEKRIRDMSLELEELGHEADAMDKDLREEKDKTSKLTVQQESGQNEIAFLREEQDGDKIKIGDLENTLNNLKASLTSEKERTKDLEHRIADERQQREILGSKEKQEVQKMMNDLNRESSSAKDESRKLKKNLQSRESEVATYKELENNIREVLGDSEGTRLTFIVSIAKLQRDLESTSSELETIQHNLSEKDRLLRNREALLESHGLEHKKVTEMLDRERQAHRATRIQFEQWEKSKQHTNRTVSQKDNRITELEQGRTSDRKKLTALETQYRDQLTERNTLLLNLWTRVSSLCGSDWQAQNSLINGHIPTLEVIANPSMLPTFGKILVNAVKSVEGLVIGFQARIKTVDRELWTEYQSVEQTLDARIKKLDRLESTVQSHRISGTFTAAPEIAKLRGENRLLKSELATLQKQEMHLRKARLGERSSSRASTLVNGNGQAAPPPPMARHHSSSAVEQLNNAQNVSPISPSRRTSSSNQGNQEIASQPIEPSEHRWHHRLKQLENRLRAEREARLLDRSGARKRLEEGAEENRRLKGELEREKARREMDQMGEGSVLGDEGEGDKLSPT